MLECRLTHAVDDLDGTRVLAAGTRLTSSVMADLAGGGNRPETCRMLDQPHIREDMEAFFSAAPYDVIFSSSACRQELFDIAGDLTMPSPVIRVLHHFRRIDGYTYRHTLLVFALSVLIARELIDDRQTLIQEISAGPTHDIGKLCIPPAILAKPTALTEAEHACMRHHALAGYVLLARYFGDADVLAARVAKAHHERKDGSGYPLGIAIDDRMVDIIMVSDIYDALISPRPYRPESYDNRSALEEITGQARAGVIDETVVRVLVSLNRRARPHYSRCTISSERRGTPPDRNVYGVIKREE